MIAYYNLTSSKTLYITKIFHDIDNYVVFFISDSLTGTRSRAIKSCVRYTSKGVPYFISNRRRIYLDECQRCKN